MDTKFNANNVMNNDTDNHNDSASKADFVENFGEALTDGYLDNLSTSSDY